MSDRYSGNQPWLRHYSAPSAINGRGGEPLLLLHHLQHIKFFIHNSPPTTNLRIAMSGRGGAKAYYRFHGGIGDGRGGRPTEDNVVARPLQLFQALDPLAFHIDIIKKAAADEDGNSVKNPVTEYSSAGTGVFLPVYPTTKSKWKIPSTKVLKNNGGMCGNGGRGRTGGDHVVGGRRSGKKKKEDKFEKRFAEEEEHKDLDEIPIELLLPSEWTY